MTSIELDVAPDAPQMARRGLLSRMIATWKRRRRERLTLETLLQLDDRMLRDIGLEPMDVHDALHGKRGQSVLLNPMRRTDGAG